MAGKRRILALVLVTLSVTLGVSAWTGRRSQGIDPLYKGEPLAYYLDKDLKIFGPVDETPRHQLVSALGALDTEALPALRRRLRARDTIVRTAMNQLAWSPVPTPWKAQPYSEAWEARKLALRAVYFVGPRASSLSADVGRLLADPEFSREAGLTLSRLGEPGVELAMAKLTDRRPLVRAHAALAIARFNGRFDPEEAAARLAHWENETDPTVLDQRRAAWKRVERERSLLARVRSGKGGSGSPETQ